MHREETLFGAFLDLDRPMSRVDPDWQINLATDAKAIRQLKRSSLLFRTIAIPDGLFHCYGPLLAHAGFLYKHPEAKHRDVFYGLMANGTIRPACRHDNGNGASISVFENYSLGGKGIVPGSLAIARPEHANALQIFDSAQAQSMRFGEQAEISWRGLSFREALSKVLFGAAGAETPLAQLIESEELVRDLLATMTTHPVSFGATASGAAASIPVAVLQDSLDVLRRFKDELDSWSPETAWNNAVRDQTTSYRRGDVEAFVLAEKGRLKPEHRLEKMPWSYVDIRAPSGSPTRDVVLEYIIDIACAVYTAQLGAAFGYNVSRHSGYLSDRLLPEVLIHLLVDEESQETDTFGSSYVDELACAINLDAMTLEDILRVRDSDAFQNLQTARHIIGGAYAGSLSENLLTLIEEIENINKKFIEGKFAISKRITYIDRKLKSLERYTGNFSDSLTAIALIFGLSSLENLTSDNTSYILDNYYEPISATISKMSVSLASIGLIAMLATMIIKRGGSINEVLSPDYDMSQILRK